MGNQTTLQDYISKNFLKNIIDIELKNYIKQNIKSFERTKLISVKKLKYENSKIKKIKLYDLPKSEIILKLFVNVKIKLLGDSTQKTNVLEEHERQYVVYCQGDLSILLSNLRVLNVSQKDYNLGLGKNVTNECLPIISKSELDNYAKKFLENYYPEALVNPIAINPKILVNNMGLTIEYHNLSTDCSIFGSIVFDDCYVSVYGGNIKNNIFFKGGTILVDPRIYEIRNTGSYNNTIIHECVHWFLHKKGFELQRLYNKNANNIQCSKENKSTKIDEKISFIEWQANAITPRILFPSLMLNKAMIKIGYNYDCKKYRSYLVDSVNDIITKLADNFIISKQSAKIRLIECGVMAANSAFVYIDGHYIKPYSFKAGSLKDFETFSISNSELYSICNRNSTIKKLISSGRIKYTNSLLCVNDSKYIKRSSIGKYILTEFAKLNVDECCIKFDKELVKSKSYSINNNNILNRNSNGNLKYKLIMDNEKNKNQILNSSMIDSNWSHIKEGLNCISSNLAATIKKLMKWVGINEIKLAEKSQLDPKTIQRLRTGKVTKPKLHTMIALTIGLDLPYKVSLEFIKIAGYSLNIEEKLNFYYDSFLWDGIDYDIYQCDEILKREGFSGFIKE